jgi:hypothetical protein
MNSFVDDLIEELVGSIAMDSVVLDRINGVADDHNKPHFESYEEAVELIQNNHGELAECPECGWFSEGNWYDHPDHDGVCNDCEVEEE